MAQHFSHYLLSGTRGRILLAATAVFLFILYLSLSADASEGVAWHSPSTRYGSTDRPDHSGPEAAAFYQESAQKPTVEHTDGPLKAPGFFSDSPKVSNSRPESVEPPQLPDQGPPHVETIKVEKVIVEPVKAASPATASKRPPKPAQSIKDEEDEYELVAPAPPALLQLKNDDCEAFPDTNDVLLVMKTGATEAYDKLPIHFMSTLKCVQDFVLFSDMEMNMAGFRLRDVLKDLNPEFVASNPDFDLYRTLQEFSKEHQDPRDLKDGGNGWNLDKYKFVPMLEQAWEYRQDANWYVFMEADSFVNWENLMHYLNQLDPTQPLYIGSPTYLDIQFAHGGTVYVVSGAAMRKAVGGHPEMLDTYGEEPVNWCCGDRMVARILLDENIELTTAWPMFNGERPITIPFGHDVWCQPVMTMHHLTAQEVSNVWNFEMRRKQRGEKGPMLWKDVFDYFIRDNLRAERIDWDNLSSDLLITPDPELDFNGRRWDELSQIERDAPSSPENCKWMCEVDENCLQWSHHSNTCQINYSIKLGKTRDEGDSDRWMSGWNLPRIQEFREAMDNCPAADWTTHPPMRH